MNSSRRQLTPDDALRAYLASLRNDFRRSLSDSLRHQSDKDQARRLESRPGGVKLDFVVDDAHNDQ
jgi:hypothetical protein